MHKVRQQLCQAAETVHRGLEIRGLDEVFIRIRGVVHCLWRAMKQHGIVIDILVQERRNSAAVKLWRRALRCASRSPQSNQQVFE